MDTGLQGRATVAVMQACRDIADYAHGLVGAADQPQTTRERIRAMRRLRLQALVALDREVLACAAGGASWAELADALGRPVGEVEACYAPLLARWTGAAPDPEYVMRLGDHVVGLPYDPDPAGTARAIDAWWARHAEPWEQAAAGPGPCERALRAHA